VGFYFGELVQNFELKRVEVHLRITFLHPWLTVHADLACDDLFFFHPYSVVPYGLQKGHLFS